MTDKTPAGKADEAETEHSRVMNKETNRGSAEENRETEEDTETEETIDEKGDSKTPSATIVETEKQISTENSKRMILTPLHLKQELSLSTLLFTQWISTGK